MVDVFQKLEPRPTDVFVAVMGMTGSGKSTFISLCTGQDIDIGHNLQACTQQVAIYKIRWSSTVDVYLVDTPGFDDTHRSDTAILKEIATWLTTSYKNNVQLNGLVYLHRITDPRIGGSARKNLFMFRKLCGAGVLKNVLLVTTMWENTQPLIGQAREEELVNTDDFWGVLVRNGATVARHNNTRESAMSLLKGLIGKDRVTMSIQKEMVGERKTLDQTQAGIELESELQKEREKFRKELEEVQEMMKHAIEARDQESAEELRNHKAEMQRKIDRILQDREDLKVTMEKMHTEKFAELERRYEEQQVKARENEARLERKLAEQREKERRTKEKLEEMYMDRQEIIEELLEKQQAQEQEAKAELDLLRRQLESKDSLAQALQQMQPLSITGPQKSNIIYRTRSAPGPNRINENASLALYGSYYYFVGPAWDYRQVNCRVPATLNDSLGEGGRSTRYVALGSDGSWYRHYHLKGKCRTQKSDNFSTHYPGLDSWFKEKKAFGCPVQVSLGNNGEYYVRMADGSWSCDLPQKIIDRGEKLSQVRRVWLGYGTDYIIERKNHHYSWSLHNYGSLAQRIKEYKPLKDIAMNLEVPCAYIILSDNGRCGYKVGSSKDSFDEFDFQEYMTGNFGNKWD